jgi:hypothetical protein
MKKNKPKYYRSPNSMEAVEIDYELLHHDYYSKEGMSRRLLGSYTDRIEASLLRKEYKKINKAQFDKMLETYADPN